MSAAVEAPSVEQPVHSYSRGAEIFKIAADSFGVAVPAAQVEEWRDLIEAAYILDNYLDRGALQADREAAYDACASLLFGAAAVNEVAIDEHKALTNRMQQTAAGWSGYKRERIASATEHVKEIAAAKREATSARHLGKLAICEGIETARFLELETNGEDKAAAFNRWLNLLLRFGVVIDSAADLPEDYANELTKTVPTRVNRLVIAAHALPLTTSLAALTPRRLYRPLLAAARVVTEDINKDSTMRGQAASLGCSGEDA